MALLEMAAANAAERAAVGEIAQGYAILHAGQRHVEEFAVEGELWAQELLALYEMALKYYVSRYCLFRD